jgi:hypothetical protein
MGVFMPFTFTCYGKCPNCGNENFTSVYRPADFAPVICLGCGHLTTVSNAIQAFEAQEPGAKPLLDGD